MILSKRFRHLGREETRSCHDVNKRHREHAYFACTQQLRPSAAFEQSEFIGKQQLLTSVWTKEVLKRQSHDRFEKARLEKDRDGDCHFELDDMNQHSVRRLLSVAW